MRNEEEVRRHAADLQSVIDQPCDCRTLEEHACHLQARQACLNALRIVRWCLGEPGDYDTAPGYVEREVRMYRKVHPDVQ